MRFLNPRLALTVMLLAVPLAGFAQSASVEAPVPTQAAALLSVDTPLQIVVADPAGKAVLDKAFPDIAKHPNFEQFKALSLRRLQPYAKDRITDDALAAVDLELKAVHPAAAAP